MKRIIRLFGRTTKHEKNLEQSSGRPYTKVPIPQPEDSTFTFETKISEIRDLLNENNSYPEKTGKILQVLDYLINMDALAAFYRKDKKLFKKVINFLEREAKNEKNAEYMNVRMTLVTVKYFIGEKKVFHRFLAQLEKNEQYHNEATILRIALEQGWTPNQGRIIVDCTVKCENCGIERKIERMVSPTQIKEFYLNPCESCGGTEYTLVHVDGQSVLQWKRDY